MHGDLVVIPAVVIAEITRGGGQDAPVNQLVKAVNEVTPCRRGGSTTSRSTPRRGVRPGHDSGRLGGCRGGCARSSRGAQK
jgi:hypothetical protein